MKRIVKKQLKLQEKSLEKYLRKKEVVISSDGAGSPSTVQFVNPVIYDDDEDDDESFISKISNFFSAIFDNLLEIFLLVVFGGCVIYFIINDDVRTFVMNFIRSFI